MIRNRHAAVGWWRNLQPDPATKHRGDRAAQARLRRCGSVVEAMHEPATIMLFRDVGATGPSDLPVVALAAAVLSHVRGEGERDLSFARLIGPVSVEQPETAPLKPLRFRRLLEAAGEEELLVSFRRAVAIAGNKVPVRDLAVSLLGWNEARRRSWIYDYWNAGRPGTPPKQAEANVAASEEIVG